MTEKSVNEHRIELVREGGSMTDDEQVDVFGESLPSGLSIR